MSEAPFFIVGAPRSGTTLFTLMLDGHPRLAIPQESHFIVRLSARRLRLEHRPEKALERIIAHPRFARWSLEPDRVRAHVAARRPATYPEVVDAVFGAYASAQGKARWGDKTPGYVRWIPALARMFPDARFIQVVRDGREVAASVAEREWWPGTAVSAAYWWRWKVRSGRRGAAGLAPERYMEVRLDALVADPEPVLRDVCAFLGEQYEPAMLGYQSRARGRVGNVGHVAARTLPREHTNLERPLTPGLRDWRAGLSPAIARAVEAACYPVAKDMGLGIAPPRWPAVMHARIRWLRETPLRLPNLFREQLGLSKADI